MAAFFSTLRLASSPTARPAAAHRAFRVAALALSVLLATAGSAVGAPQPPATDPGSDGALTLLAPFPGQALFTNRLADVVVTGPDPEKWLREGVAARILLEADAQTLLLAEGDLRSDRSPEAIDTVIDLAEVPPGRYVLAVEVEGAGRVAAPVSVNLPPVGSLSLTGAERTDAGVAVTFAVEAESPAGTPIEGFLWDFGDGSPPVPTREPAATHLYAELPEKVSVSVEVRDAIGGAGQVVVILAQVPGGQPVLQAAPSCACAEMRIFHQGTTAFYCAPAAPGGGLPPQVTRLSECRAAGALAPAGTCPAGQIAFLCDRGPLPLAPPANPRFGFGFEVVGFLAPGSVPALCGEGQYIQTTRTIDGSPVRPNNAAVVPPPAGRRSLPRTGGGTFEFTAVPAGTPKPDRGAAEWGSDDYATPGTHKQHSGSQIRWSDAPGLLSLAGLRSVTQDLEFIAFIRGPANSEADTCWCRFRIEQSWTAAGGLQGMGLRSVDGNRCAYDPPVERAEEGDGIPVLPGPWILAIFVTALAAVALRLAIRNRKDRAAASA